MFKIGYILCILGYSLSFIHAKFSFIKPCKLEDSACLLSSSQAAVPYMAPGIPDHGIKGFEPLRLDKVNGDQGDLLLEFRDLQITGLSKCKFTSFQAVSTNNFNFSMDCPILATGKYHAGGKLMFLSIDGDGPFELKTEKIGIKAAAELETIERSDGKKHWHITKIDYVYIPEERIYIRLDNLYNGDEERAKPVLEVLNNSWKELILELGRPIIDRLVLKLKDDTINMLFQTVPLDELVIQ